MVLSCYLDFAGEILRSTRSGGNVVLVKLTFPFLGGIVSDCVQTPIIVYQDSGVTLVVGSVLT